MPAQPRVPDVRSLDVRRGDTRPGAIGGFMERTVQWFIQTATDHNGSLSQPSPNASPGASPTP
jgi:hypothetical protein